MPSNFVVGNNVSSLCDTSGWGDNRCESPVVEGVVEDPAAHQASGEDPTGGVTHLVGLSLLGEFPESGKVHFFFLSN